ncbi:MAG: ABC transporter ATP-binding protein [Nitrospirae bacterium]|nr:ABC transporter ATP-binding protein [Nitrospirota bacterium]
MTQIVLEGVTKTYGVGGTELQAVNGASLRVEKGEFVSIIGHSGSGKTTLLSILGGILRPTSGRVFFEGDDIYSYDSDRLSEYRCGKIGFVFQFASLLPMLTAKENLLLPVAFHRQSLPARAEEKALELLDLVGLAGKADARPSQMSGGQQRRVAIARAFMNDPVLILADEPTGDLDEETEAEVMRIFAAMNEKKGITFLLVTHNSELAGQAKRRFSMSNGSIGEFRSSS